MNFFSFFIIVPESLMQDLPGFSLFPSTYPFEHSQIAAAPFSLHIAFELHLLFQQGPLAENN